MKKKIKDLTLEEVKEICRKNACYSCPLDVVPCYDGFYALKDYELEIEIEVDEE